MKGTIKSGLPKQRKMVGLLRHKLVMMSIMLFGVTIFKEIEDLNVSPEMTTRKMATNFMRKNNAFKTNRVILSRFIDLITENTTA